MMAYEQMKMIMVESQAALPGRALAVSVADRHVVLGTPMVPPWPAGHDQVVLGLGCFWGAERLFWQLPGVYTTAVGYAGGFTPNPSYEEVCSARTGHAEVVLVVFDPGRVVLEELLGKFFEGHDPTQYMRQGGDLGTQYRSIILTNSLAQARVAQSLCGRYEEAVARAGYGEVVTEIAPRTEFYYAEDYHQQYLAKNPFGYCGLGGTGVSCPTAVS